MNVLTEIVAVILAGLSFLLAGIGAAAGRRYGDTRLTLVAAGLAVIGGIGVLSVLHELSPLYGGPFAIDPIPLSLLVIAVGLLYLAFVRGGARQPPP